MTTKGFLQQPLDIEAQINADLLEMERIRSLAEKTTSTISCDPVSNGTSGGRIEGCVELLGELEKKVMENRDSLLAARWHVYRAILNQKIPREREILIMRYLDYAKWAKICDCSGYSRTTANRIHDQGVAHVGEYLKTLDNGTQSGV